MGWGKFDSLVALVVASALLANKDEVLDDVSASLHQDVATATARQIEAAGGRATADWDGEYDPCARSRRRNNSKRLAVHGELRRFPSYALSTAPCLIFSG